MSCSSPNASASQGCSSKRSVAYFAALVCFAIVVGLVVTTLNYRGNCRLMETKLNSMFSAMDGLQKRVEAMEDELRRRRQTELDKGNVVGITPPPVVVQTNETAERLTSAKILLQNVSSRVSAKREARDGGTEVNERGERERRSLTGCRQKLKTCRKERRGLAREQRALSTKQGMPAVKGDRGPIGLTGPKGEKGEKGTLAIPPKKSAVAIYLQGNGSEDHVSPGKVFTAWKLRNRTGGINVIGGRITFLEAGLYVVFAQIKHFRPVGSVSGHGIYQSSTGSQLLKSVNYNQCAPATPPRPDGPASWSLSTNMVMGIFHFDQWDSIYVASTMGRTYQMSTTASYFGAYKID